MDRVIQESVALNRSHDSLVNGGTDGYGREESGAESDEAFSDWDSCEELMLVGAHLHFKCTPTFRYDTLRFRTGSSNIRYC